MFKNRKFYIFSSLFLALAVLFSACNMGKSLETTDGGAVETTSSSVIMTTTETPVLYETVHLTPRPAYEDIGASLCVAMKQYHWSGYGVGTKLVEDEAYALYLSNLLQNAPETGTILPALSDSTEWVTENSGHLPARPGTLWLETQNGFYRLTDDYTSLCRVDYHLGEGKELEMSSELHDLILNLWQYYPYEYYSGTYQDGKLIIAPRFDAQSSVSMIVKDIHVSRDPDEIGTITVEISSEIDQTLAVSLTCQQSDDNLGLGDGKTLNLAAGQIETVTLSFVGWTDVGYEILLCADQTRVHIWIAP